MEGIGDERADIIEIERCQDDLLYPRSALTDPLQRAREWVKRTDLVVAIGPDQHQVPHIWISNHVLQQFKGCRVQPLQIIKKQRERVLRPGEHVKEMPEHKLKA